MLVGDLLRALHVLTVLYFVACLVGRQMVRARAARSTDIREVAALSGMAGVFELQIRPASAVVLIFGLVTAWVRGWPILGFLQGAGSNWVLVSLLLYLSILPVIALVFVPHGKALHAALAEAVAAGQVTPALAAALRDPVVGAAHVYESLLLVALTLLMTLKPF